MALDMQKGDKVSILGYTCYKWVLTDAANMSVGLGTVFQTVTGRLIETVGCHSRVTGLSQNNQGLV